MSELSTSSFENRQGEWKFKIDFNVIWIEAGILIDKNVLFLTFEHEHTMRNDW